MDKVAERKAFEASEFVKTIMHRYEWSDGFSNYQIKDVVVNGNVFDFIEAQNDQPILNGAWYGWQAAKSQSVPEAKLSRCVTLTCAQLREALNFGAPDNDDQEQLETEMTIVWSDKGHSGEGYYCYYSELPEEGAIFLDEVIEAQEQSHD